MDRDNGPVDNEALRRRVESIRRASWSVCVEAERVMVEYFNMPPEQRLTTNRAERQQSRLDNEATID